MEHKKTLLPVIESITKLFRKYHLSYDQSKYVVQEARKICELKPVKGRNKGTVKRLSKDHIKAFLDFAFKKDAKTGLMMATLYESATRVDEFVNLMPGDLLVSDLVLIIRNGKGDKRREVPITENLARALQVHLQERKSGYLFESNRNHKFTTRRIEQIVEEIAMSAKISQKVSPHTLRHTRATLLSEAGMAKDYLQRFLGHESTKTTEIYTLTAGLDVKREFYRVTSLKISDH
ncbi:MAG: tyrosine-type recombinase/integrase [Daejeonella sp.]